jgi:O-antigen ligase
MLRTEGFAAPGSLRDMAPGRRQALARRDRLLTRLREVFIFVAFAIYVGALTPALRNLRSEAHLHAGETDPFFTVAQLTIMAVVGIYLLRHWQNVRETLRPLAPYLLIIALCAVSALWSDYPFATIRRSVSLLTCFGFGLFCYLELGLAGTITRLGRCMMSLLVLSLVVWLLLPSVGSETLSGYEGALRGVFSTKNNTGTAVEFSISYCFYRLVRDRRVLRPAIALVLLVMCLVLVRSSTAASVSFALLSFGTVAYMWRSRFVLLLLFASVSVVVGFVAVTLIDPALPFQVVGRGSDLTGRVPLWQAALEAISQRPWLGYGYSGFWTADSRAVHTIWRTIGWEAPSAHNGYIDTALQLGVIGLALFLRLWGRIVYDAIVALRRDGMPEAVWILLMMLGDVLLNFSEGTMSYPDLFTAMMPGVLITLYQARREQVARVTLRRRRQRVSTWQDLANAEPRPTATDAASHGGATP